jgi:hypothetical protein
MKYILAFLASLSIVLIFDVYGMNNFFVGWCSCILWYLVLDLYNKVDKKQTS